MPRRTRQSNIRREVVRADPEWNKEAMNPVEYEFGEKKFRGRYQERGAYASEE